MGFTAINHLDNFSVAGEDIKEDAATPKNKSNGHTISGGSWITPNSYSMIQLKAATSAPRSPQRPALKVMDRNFTLPPTTSSSFESKNPPSFTSTSSNSSMSGPGTPTSTTCSGRSVHFDGYIVTDVWEAPHTYDRRMSEDTLMRLLQMHEKKRRGGKKTSSSVKTTGSDDSSSTPPASPTSCRMEDSASSTLTKQPAQSIFVS